MVILLACLKLDFRSMTRRKKFFLCVRQTMEELQRVNIGQGKIDAASHFRLAYGPTLHTRKQISGLGVHELNTDHFSLRWVCSCCIPCLKLPRNPTNTLAIYIFFYILLEISVLKSHYDRVLFLFSLAFLRHSPLWIITIAFLSDDKIVRFIWHYCFQTYDVCFMFLSFWIMRFSLPKHLLTISNDILKGHLPIYINT